jgi:hypothetical protein
VRLQYPLRGVTGVRLARAAVVSGIVLAGFMLAGCGGSGGQESATDTTTTAEGDAATRAEFLAKGDALCAQGQSEAAELARRAQEIQARSGTVPDEELLAQAAAVWDEQIRLVVRFRDQLDELEPPAGDEERVQQFIVALDDGLEIAREIQASLADGEEPSRERVQSYVDIVNRGNTLARAYGFTVCGKTGS